MRQRFGNLGMSVFSAVLALALPKCPFCVVGFLTLLGVFGISASAYTDHMPTFVGICLGLTVASFALPPANRRFLSPLPLSIVASLAVWLGRFSLTNDPLFYGGVTLLVFASLWNLIANLRRLRGEKKSCCTVSAPVTLTPIKKTSVG